MKSVILISLILLAAYAETPEECVRSNCPDEVRSCELNAFCVAKAIGCNNTCGGIDDLECIMECADNSGNQRLINLSTCGKAHCLPADFFYDFLQNRECDLVGCAQKLRSECLENITATSFECALGFFERNPDCDCVRE